MKRSSQSVLRAEHSALFLLIALPFLLPSARFLRRNASLLAQDLIAPATSAFAPQNAPVRLGSPRSEDGQFDAETWKMFTDEDTYRKDPAPTGLPAGSGVGVDYGSVQLRIFGRTRVYTTYGRSWYVSEKDRLNDTKIATSNAIKNGFNLDLEMRVSIQGRIGKTVTVTVDFDANEAQNNQTFNVQYKALNSRELIQEVTVGNIDLKFPKSEFAVFQQNSKKTIGLDTKLRRGKLSFHGIATLTRGQNAMDVFTGGTRQSSTLLQEYRYTARKYYQLEPFLYYDNQCITSDAGISADSYDPQSASRLRVFTSRSESPDAFRVGITPGSVRILVDDRDPRNDTTLNARPVTIGGSSLGNYHLFVEGKDYSINYETGRLQFVIPLRLEARVLVAYNRPGGSCDPSVFTEPGLGLPAVFIKWDGALNEDLSRDGGADITQIDDGVTNYDSHEVRGVYEIGAQNINQYRFSLGIVDRSFQSVNQLEALGPYVVDFAAGRITFLNREPFRSVLKADSSPFYSFTAISSIYNDRQPTTVVDNSELSLRFDYVADVFNYRLSHTNIIQGSVSVRVNGEVIAPEKYFVDYLSGFFAFINPTDPVIGQNSQIEVRYEYSPFGGSTQGFIAGLRSEYEATRDVKIGSTILYNGAFQSARAPQIGSEPGSKLVLEGDIDMRFNEDRLTRLANSIPGFEFDLIPAKLNVYAEGARSIFNVNTFGVALIDDMESSEESIEIEISDKDWQLSAIPANPVLSACDRAPLLYRYFRDPSDIRRGLLPLSSGARSSPAYSQLAGPYNASEGHLAASQLDTTQAERQVSVVFDFDFASVTPAIQPFVFAQTRNFSSGGRDFSQVRYVEFNARLEGENLAGGVELLLDAGVINEDSDGDGILDSEDFGLDRINGDTNNNNVLDAGEVWDSGERNGILDSERESGRNEDRGYPFQTPLCPLSTIVGAGPDISGFEVTKGNGVLNTEDTDRDGVLSTAENTIRLVGPPASLPYLIYDRGTDNTIRPGDWKLFRIFIDPSLIASDNDRLALRLVRSLRLGILGGSSPAGRGRLLIDGIRFVGARWRNGRLESGGVATEAASSVINGVIIDNYSARDEYDSESFLRREPSAYETYHGPKTNTELARTREATLKITYGGGLSAGDTAVVQRTFVTPFDIRFYEAVAVWINVRSSSPGDQIVVRIGSSVNDYLEYRFPMSGGGWRKLRMPVGKPDRTFGSVNIREISYMAAGVVPGAASPSGELWVNEIIAESPKALADDGYKLETEMQIMQPVFVTESGVPILSDIKMLYKEKHRGRDFAGIGQVLRNFDEDRTEFSLKTKVFPFWEAAYAYTRETTSADPNAVFQWLNQQGESDVVTHFTKHDFNFKDASAPKISVQHSYRDQKNTRFEEIAGATTTNPQEQTVKQREQTWNPVVFAKQNLVFLKEHNLTWDVKSSVRFFQKDAETNVRERDGTPVSRNNQNEKEQSEETITNLEYRFRGLTVKPGVSSRRVELVSKNYTDNSNLVLINGDFHVPWFDRSSDSRFRERASQYSFTSTYKNLYIFSPTVTLNAKYQENSFRDNQQAPTRETLSRLKDPITNVNTSLSVPIDLRQMNKDYTFLPQLTPQFSRELILTETALPVNARTGLYDEQYGISRTMPPLLDRSANFFAFPFWHHFTSGGGANNFRRAREYIAGNSFSPDRNAADQAVFLNYNNALSIQETLSTNSQWAVYKPLALNANVRMTQKVSRSGLDALPVHNASWGFSVLQTWNLIQLTDWFIWKEKNGRTSSLQLNYTFDRAMRITENVREDRHNPVIAFTFGWLSAEKLLSNVTVSAGVAIRRLAPEDYIVPGRNPLDDAIFQRILTRNAASGQRDSGYNFSVEYQTEVRRLREALERLTSITLRHNPRYIARFSMAFNRYRYDLTQTLTQQATDQYILYNKLDMNLHPNVSGEFDITAVWDVYRQADTNAVRQEIVSLQVGFGARILF